MLSVERSTTRALLPLAIGFFLLIASSLGSVWLSARQEAANGWVQHTLEVQSQLALIRRHLAEAESSQRGFLLTLNPAYLPLYDNALMRLPGEIDTLDTQTRDNPREQVAVARLRIVVADKIAELRETVTLAGAGHLPDALDILHSGRGQRTVAEIRSIGIVMAREERRLLALRTADASWITLSVRILLVASSFLVIMFAAFAIRASLRRVRALEAANLRLTEEVLERRNAQTQVRQLQKMEAVGQLTGGIAHDFNNMLAIVIGSLDMAKRRLTGVEHPNLAKSLDNAREGAERAAALTARLLAFSRQQPLEPKVVDTNKLVGGMSEMLRRTLGERVQVETVLAGGLWRIHADPTQIESALVNLAVNARDAMPGGGKLTIETGNAELDERYAADHDEVVAGQYVVLSVTDTGTGMAPEVIERAFDPFYTTKGVGRGTGLGLSQVFGFVKQSHGHVKIYSEIGQGTTIKLYMPRYGGDEAESALNSAASGPIPQGQPEEIILVVEDESRVRHMSVDALRELGYTVVQASDGNQALEQLAVQPRIDLMFTDIIMPGMTGRQLAERALEQWPDLRILYTTGYTRNAIVHNGIVDYGVSFLQKPFSISALARKIREVLDS